MYQYGHGHGVPQDHEEYNPQGGYGGYGSNQGYYPHGSNQGYYPHGSNQGYYPHGSNQGYNPNGSNQGYYPHGSNQGYYPHGSNDGYSSYGGNKGHEKYGPHQKQEKQNQQQIDPKNPPQNCHEHPINYSDSINDSCKICQQKITGQPGYNCGSCKLILCLNCGKRVFFGKRNISFHPHSLTLMIRQSWHCDLCKQRYRNAASFYCKECDYDICTSCYVAY